MAQDRRDVVAWVGQQVLPHEGDVRAWLRGLSVSEHQVDDIVQEAYCRIAALDSIAHIASGRAYLFGAARNIMLEQIRRSRIVRFETMSEIERLEAADGQPSPEQAVDGRRQLERVKALIAALPDRCRQVFELRRVQGLSQRETAARLGVTENVVEAQTARGLKLVLKALADPADQPVETQHVRRVHRP
ncbi:RNA polymerase subunit sigma-24 [Caulobacter mirabilis]|uniref:RNA polymerase subunit sigma-24 n=2 Tax=Caulobacter mirabilis TaxID=69666 RepID=A0A2D2AU34_9CAUL|nr:RNA polymerase subunit sigma-24 [Caulobacter mirabilis]